MEKKDVLQFEFAEKEKIYRYLWDVFLILWTLLGLGRDKLNLKIKLLICHYSSILQPNPTITAITH